MTRPDGFYRTVFGPSVGHDGVTYCNCNKCVALALRRLTAARGSLEEEYALQDAQARALCAPELRAFLQRVKEQYAPHIINNFTSPCLEAHDHHDDPHPKKALRIQAWGELLEGVRNTINERLWLRTVTYKLKREEIAKPGKFGRMIGDLGVAASLQGFRLTEALKQAQDSERIHLNGGYARFVKAPTPEVLKEVFDDLMAPPGRFVFIFFSDDACYSVRRNGRVHMYNLDISSCDASHGLHIFQALIDLMPEGAPKETMQILVDQCSLPIEIRDVDNPKNRVVLRPKTPRLYSGSTITTAINNLANLLICYHISATDDNPVVSAAKCGYIITMQECERPEDLQFLKHSPILTAGGEYQPLINLGVVLRLSGVCKGDLPGKGDISERARAFQQALLNGVAPGASFTVLDNMRHIVRGPESAECQRVCEKEDEYKLRASAAQRFDDHSLYARYRLTLVDVDELLEFSKAPLGSICRSAALDKIMNCDYGLRVPY